MLRGWLVLAALLTAVGSASATLRTGDPPVIVPWHKIGSVGLGMSRSSVNYRYGAASGPTPTYRVPGGHLYVGYAGNQVARMSTDSQRYRTPDGVGVGTQTPLGPCLRTKAGSCKYHWHEFTYNASFSDWETFFCYGGVHAEAWLAVEQGVVKSVGIDYAPGACGNAKPRFPLTATDRSQIDSAIHKELDSLGAHVYRITHYQVTVDGKFYASAAAYGKDTSGHEVQGAFVVLQHRGAWRIVDYGTSGVGCGHVPIKYLTQIGGNCPG